MKLTLTGYSTALFSTWILVEELGILFDCGDGAVSGLLQKSRKARSWSSRRENINEDSPTANHSG